MIESEEITDENYLTHVLRFRDRQAGISVVYDPQTDDFSFVASAVETQQLVELWSAEYPNLDAAVAAVNSEFGTWELTSLGKKDSAGCGTCAAH